MANKTAFVVKDNKLQEVDDSEVDIELTNPSRLVGTHANIVPLQNNAQSQRWFYASRFVNQAMPLKTRETPLVQTYDDELGDSFEHHFGERAGARFWRNDQPGEVVDIKPDNIKIKTSDGKTHDIGLYDNFQFNRKTYIHNTPQVKVGDKVKPNQLLASSNFTDDKGTLSMGANARIALVAYKGHSMDDAIVASESFANRMVSQHNYEHGIQKDEDVKFGKNHYKSVFPMQFTVDQLNTLDEDGIVKPGTVLRKGDPIILATRPKAVTSDTEHLGRLGKIFKTMRTDAAEVWEHDYPGIVKNVVNGKKNARAYITADVPLQVGDKLISSRPGQKSIVSKILPDDQMLRDLNGKPFDLLLNQLALPSRVNTATLYEMQLGKIAAHRGEPLKMRTFEKGSRLEQVKKMLAEEGLSDTEEVFDPVLNRKLAKPVSTGINYVYKLHHVVESKKSARGNSAYTMDQQPLKGGGDSAKAKRLGGLETTAMMAKGGYATLREASTLRGQKCFDASTEVLTHRGWVHWDKVVESDRLLTKARGEGGVAWFEKPEKLVQYEFTGELYGYQNHYIDWLVTPDHKLWCKPVSDGTYAAITAKKAYARESMVETGIKHIMHGIEEKTIPDTSICTYVMDDGTECVTLQVPTDDMCRMLAKLPEKVIKRVPETMYMADRYYIKAYLDELLRDKINQLGIMYVDTKEFAGDIQALAILAGHSVRVMDDMDPGKYAVCFDDKKEAFVSNIYVGEYLGHYKKYYNGTVYCATMRTGMLFVRRNGKAMWSCNCDDYWRLLRQGYTPAEPGAPFIWDKFHKMLNGAGLNARDLGGGTLRLAPMTDADVDDLDPMEIKNAKILNPATMEGVKDGLFDERLVANNKWGKLTLGTYVPNPAFEKTICTLLGITKAELRDVIAGNRSLEEVRDKSKKSKSK